MRRRRLLIAAGAALALAGTALVRSLAYDLDGDGRLDSLSLGRSAVHLLLTREQGTAAPGRRPDGGRLYRVPPAYAHLLLKKTFDWDSRWDLLAWDPGRRVAEAVRLADRARVSVEVDEWRGWTVVRVTVLDAGAGAREEAAAAVFQCLESVLFHGMDTPRTVRGFAPRE